MHRPAVRPRRISQRRRSAAMDDPGRVRVRPRAAAAAAAIKGNRARRRSADNRPDSGIYSAECVLNLP